MSPEALRAAGESSMARALGLTAEGRTRAAREALLLGQRFLRAAEVLAGAAGTGPQPEPETEEEGEDDPTAELEARLHRIVHTAFDQDEAVAKAIGLEDVRWLDLSAFALPGGGWRRATEAGSGPMTGRWASPGSGWWSCAICASPTGAVRRARSRANSPIFTVR